MVKLTINYLSKDELLYEVGVRCVDPVGSVVELRQLLTELSQLEMGDSDSIIDYHAMCLTLCWLFVRDVVWRHGGRR